MIKEEDLTKARVAWGDGIIAISKAYEEQGIKKTLYVQMISFTNHL